jgi:hypothetical protein
MPKVVFTLLFLLVYGCTNALSQSATACLWKPYFEFCRLNTDENAYARQYWVFLFLGKDPINDRKLLAKIFKQKNLNIKIEKSVICNHFNYNVSFTHQFNSYSLGRLFNFVDLSIRKQELSLIDFGIMTKNKKILYASAIQSTYRIPENVIIKGLIMNRFYSGISYANISSCTGNIGSLANEYGSFELNIPNNLLQDSLLFIAPGYQHTYILASTLMGDSMNVVILKDLEPFTLNTIYSVKRNPFFLDRTGRGKSYVIPQFYEPGGQIAKAFFTHKPVMLTTVSFYVKQCTSFPMRVRLRLYELDTINQLPGNELTSESIILEPDFAQGWINFDIESYEFVTHSTIVVAIEWLDNSYQAAAIGCNRPNANVFTFTKLGSGFDWSTEFAFDWSIKCCVKIITP